MAYFTNAIFYVEHTLTDRLWTCMIHIAILFSFNQFSDQRHAIRQRPRAGSLELRSFIDGKFD